MSRKMANLVRRSEQSKFVGRREEQKAFRQSIQNLMRTHSANLSADESLFSHVFLLHGDGGMGKTTLVNRFSEICQEEGGTELAVFSVDWELYKNQPISSSIDVMDILYGTISKKFEKEMKFYKDAREQREVSPH